MKCLNFILILFSIEILAEPLNSVHLSKAEKSFSGEVDDTLKVLQKFSQGLYSEGLEIYNDNLWLSWQDGIQKISMTRGDVTKNYKNAKGHSEGIVWINDKIYNGVYCTKEIFEGELINDQLIYNKIFPSPDVCIWGIVFTGTDVIVTGNYSNKLFVLDYPSFKLKRTITVSGGTDLEDLAWDGQYLWTSSFTQRNHQIFAVDPMTGKIKSFFKLPEESPCKIIDGIAYDSRDATLWLTGKNCPLYQVERPYVF